METEEKLQEIELGGDVDFAERESVAHERIDELNHKERELEVRERQLQEVLHEKIVEQRLRELQGQNTTYSSGFASYEAAAPSPQGFAQNMMSPGFFTPAYVNPGFVSPIPSQGAGSPNLQILPTFDGTRKGLTARSWLVTDLEQVRALYNLSDQKMTPLARLRCIGKARDWAEIQPEHQSWEEFKSAFLLEYGEKNQNKLFFEMINHTQDDSSVGEYATTMQRYFRQLTNVTPEKQKEYFVRNLKMGLRESVFAASPSSLAQAIEIARRVEDMYAALPGKQEEPGTEIRRPPEEIVAFTDDESDASSDSSGYESSDTESQNSDQEIFAGKRRREPEPRREAEAPGGAKAQKRDVNQLPRKREAVKPVLNPLSAEEKQKRKKTRERNREINRETNLGIIRSLLKGVQQDIAAHRNLKHFRTDLHHHIDKILFHNREEKKAVRPPKVDKSSRDVCRSTKHVKFFWAGKTILTPLLHETSDDDVKVHYQQNAISAILGMRNPKYRQEQVIEYASRTLTKQEQRLLRPRESFSRSLSAFVAFPFIFEGVRNSVQNMASFGLDQHMRSSSSSPSSSRHPSPASGKRKSSSQDLSDMEDVVPVAPVPVPPLPVVVPVHPQQQNLPVYQRDPDNWGRFPVVRDMFNALFHIVLILGSTSSCPPSIFGMTSVGRTK
ncbi:hypothetical protein KFL_008600030 [Klebsormidium nitens]|uniref:Ty3 transposon capsid-like protein domain-containing protein n=1 Tax=Klebsormidium nitens TaxID=105231 RepID=A0A1Y1INZ5_KLENI|nr:hypothetical protein KFL_008600030 [Klebsormidium nitens]|eukprot:GAQ91812.1 hypothetical protein KFL_008600030 [Klebsormidium nitens]